MFVIRQLKTIRFYDESVKIEVPIRFNQEYRLHTLFQVCSRSYMVKLTRSAADSRTVEIGDVELKLSTVSNASRA